MPYRDAPVTGSDEDAVLHKRLASARVGIIGLGGLGSNVAWMLVRAEIGTLVLVDFDTVDPSNLNRQFYFADQVGRLKTEACMENLLRIDPNADLVVTNTRVTENNLAEIFANVDLISEAVDTAEDKAMILSVAGEALPGVPLISASGLAGYGSANDIVTRRLTDDVWMVGDLVSDTSDHPLFASRVTVAAAHQAHMAVRILLGLTEP
ncbi:MAG: sulfur carrier protein ThiS adenylyltransferase ThiF [Coriobacteriales bacterium]